MLLAWQANLDIQPVFNYYKAVSYMCAYFSKSESESSQALIQASQEVRTQKMNVRESMYKLASAFATSRQISLQEAVYFTLPELWQRKCYPKSIFVNTNIPSKRIRMCKSEGEIEQLDPESTDIFKRNMIERYVDRPNRTFNNGRYAIADTLCLATFLAYYYLPFELQDANDSQPDILNDDSINNASNSLPSTLPLMSTKEKLKCRKVRQVLRYRRAPNNDLYPEEYAHHILFLFYPFRNEDELLLNRSYCHKLAQADVISTVNENKFFFEPYGEQIESAFALLNSNRSFNVNETDVTNVPTHEDNYQEPVLFDSAQTSRSSIIPPSLVTDDTLREMIRSLNCQQREVFNIIYSWAKNKIKYSNCALKHEVKPVRLFVSGGAGVGKSYLTKTIFEALTKILNFQAGSPDKVKVLKNSSYWCSCN